MTFKSKDSSYKKVQECLDVVAKEFKYQGHTMAGPCADAQHAGSMGQRTGNIARDIKRKFDRMLEDDVFRPLPFIYKLCLPQKHFEHIFNETLMGTLSY